VFWRWLEKFNFWGGGGWGGEIVQKIRTCSLCQIQLSKNPVIYEIITGNMLGLIMPKKLLTMYT